MSSLLAEVLMSLLLTEALMSLLLIEVLDILPLVFEVVEVSALNSSLLNTPKMGTLSGTVTLFSIKPIQCIDCSIWCAVM